MLDPKIAPVDVETPRSAWPRLLSRTLAASYFSCSVREIDRLIGAGALSVVRLPVRRHLQTGVATLGKNRRVLIDRLELDGLAERHRQRVGALMYRESEAAAAVQFLVCVLLMGVVIWWWWLRG